MACQSPTWSIDPPRLELLILPTDLVVEARPIRAVLPEIAMRMDQEHLVLAVVHIAIVQHRQIAGGEIALATLPLDAAGGNAGPQQAWITGRKRRRARRSTAHGQR